MSNILVDYGENTEKEGVVEDQLQAAYNTNTNNEDDDEESDSENVHLIRDSLKAIQLAETSFDKLLSNAPVGVTNNNPSQDVASELPENVSYHLMFLHHPNDTIWVQHVVDKLQQSQYRCCYVGQCGSSSMSHHQGRDCTTTVLELEEMMLLSQKLVVIVSSSLVTELVYTEQGDQEASLWHDLDLCNFGGKEAVGLWLCGECELPPDLCKIPIVCVDDCDQGWWGQFIGWVAAAPRENDQIKTEADTHPETIETSFMNFNGSVVSENTEGTEVLDMEIQGTSTTGGLKSGVLVSSITSRWRCCGREVFSTRLPEDFCYCQLQLSPEDFQEVVSKVNGSKRVRWHAWCFSAPCIGGGLLFLLALCLVAVPLIEDRLIFHDSQLGFEYVHGLVLWMLILTVYLIATHFLKIKVSSDLNQQLTEVNGVLVRSNIFATLEEMGILDYSKLSLHFFYYEIGPCLGYLQDLVEPRQALCNGHTSHTSQMLQSHLTCDIDVSDTAILDQQVHSQHSAEDLIVEHASHYLNCLLGGKLRTPLTPRHLDTHVCLCQFMEYRLSAQTLTL